MDLQLSQARPDWARLEDYFGLWSMHEPQFDGLWAVISGMNLADHVSGRMIVPFTQIQQSHIEELQADGLVLQPRAAMGGSVGGAEKPYQMTASGIALIPIKGTLMKQQSSFSSATSTVAARRMVRAAKNDPDVLGVVGVFETPGGTVSGTSDLASDWAALEAVKPTAAFCEDLCASAGYWIASQCGFVACNPTALVGSIGTFMAVHDYSGRAEDMKVKVHVIKAGDFKGAGTPGTAITDEQLANWQAMVNSLNEQFMNGVSAGRKMSAAAVKSLADGRVHVGAAAKQLGLVDAVQTLDETIRQVEAKAGQRGLKKGTKMADTTLTAPVAATLDELTAHLQGADDAFLMTQLKGKVSLEQARSNWMAEMKSRLDAKNAELASAKKEEDDLKALGADKSKGTEPLGTKPAEKTSAALMGGDDGPVSEQWNTTVRQIMDERKCTKSQAISRLTAKDPELHQAYLAEVNANRKS